MNSQADSVNKKLIFFGNEQLSSTRAPTKNPIFRMLIDEGYDIEALIIKDSPQKSRKPRVHPIALLAEKHQIPVLRVSTQQELESSLKGKDAATAILVAFGMIIPQKIIDHFPGGIVNIHPSLLPAYRGTTPIESAILDGVDETGVSIMDLSPKMDAGGIYAYGTHPLSGNEKKSELTEELGIFAAEMLRHTLPGIMDGSITKKPQDDSQATYTQKLSKDDATIDWTKSATAIEREIRALEDWPGSSTSFAGLDITITKARVIRSRMTPGQLMTSDGKLIIGCAEGALQVHEIKIPGKGTLSAADFINGYL